MKNNTPDDVYEPRQESSFHQESIVMADLAPEPPHQRPSGPRRGRQSWQLPLVLFVLTCVSTFLAFPGSLAWLAWEMVLFQRVPTDISWSSLGADALLGLKYSASLMTILICHEMGHFLQTRRYGVRASLPIFLPMPIPPIGTIGAVIRMSSNMGDRRALFDIGISGPLAGLVPTLIFCLVGLQWSHVAAVSPQTMQFGDPLLLRLLVWLEFGPLPAGHDVMLHPMAFAAWVGLLVTSLNLIPIGQLDGGHVLYALLRKKAHRVASFLLMAAGCAVVVGLVFYSYPAWILMVLLLLVMGPIHPPTANDDVPLGTGRIILGWLTLAFIFIGFTPMPFKL